MFRTRFITLAVAALLLAASARAQTIDPLRAPELETGRWAARALDAAGQPKGSTWPEAWRRQEAGSLDDFMARGGDYTRLFPSPGWRMAALVTWSRPASAAHGLEVTARVRLIDAAGDTRSAFDVEPLAGFDVADDGGYLVGHGEQMARLIQCGALNTELAFYAGDGRAIARVRRADFSPAYATALQTTGRRVVIGVTGQLLAYDLATGRQLWRHELAAGDRPQLLGTPDGESLIVNVTPTDGDTRLLRLDGAGVEQAAATFHGHINPGTGLAFAADLLVVHEASALGSTFRLLEPRTLRALRSVTRN